MPTTIDRPDLPENGTVDNTNINSDNWLNTLLNEAGVATGGDVSDYLRAIHMVTHGAKAGSFCTAVSFYPTYTLIRANTALSVDLEGYGLGGMIISFVPTLPEGATTPFYSNEIITIAFENQAAVPVKNTENGAILVGGGVVCLIYNGVEFEVLSQAPTASSSIGILFKAQIGDYKFVYSDAVLSDATSLSYESNGEVFRLKNKKEIKEIVHKIRNSRVLLSERAKELHAITLQIQHLTYLEKVIPIIKEEKKRQEQRYTLFEETVTQKVQKVKTTEGDTVNVTHLINRLHKKKKQLEDKSSKLDELIKTRDALVSLSLQDRRKELLKTEIQEYRILSYADNVFEYLGSAVPFTSEDYPELALILPTLVTPDITNRSLRNTDGVKAIGSLEEDVIKSHTSAVDPFTITVDDAESAFLATHNSGKGNIVEDGTEVPSSLARGEYNSLYFESNSGSGWPHYYTVDGDAGTAAAAEVRFSVPINTHLMDSAIATFTGAEETRQPNLIGEYYIKAKVLL